jgi:uncharacterized paraquat-inducible protein A
MTHHQVFSGRNIIAALFLIGSIVFFVLGVTHPLMSTKYQVIGIRLKSQEVTLFDSIRLFWESKDYFVSLIILVFTFILPISKYFELALRIITGKKYLVLQSVDKWNMIDVFLVAMLLLNFKMNSNFIVMRLEEGTNFIALAVITRLVTIALLDSWFLKTISIK